MTKNILVIDDHYAVRKSFTLALYGTNYVVDTAESGRQGLEMLQSKKYQLAFLDLKMPEMNGIETFRKIREIDKDLIIYFITAFHREFLDELNQLAQAAQDFELLQKPIDDYQIVGLVDSLLKNETEG